MSKTIEQRFYSKVNKTKKCWYWIGANRGGNNPYGNLRFGKKRILAHRISWVIHNGDIPKGLFVLHTCDNPKCVNPKHLFLGTWDDNNKDRNKKGRTIVQHGENSHFHKLTEKEVLFIRNEFKTKDITLTSLSKKFNVSITAIKMIVDRQNWKHI